MNFRSRKKNNCEMINKCCWRRKNWKEKNQQRRWKLNWLSQKRDSKVVLRVEQLRNKKISNKLFFYSFEIITTFWSMTDEGFWLRWKDVIAQELFLLRDICFSRLLTWDASESKKMIFSASKKWLKAPTRKVLGMKMMSRTLRHFTCVLTC